jgi:hypothetical protein
VCSPVHFYFLYAWRTERECSFHSDTVRGRTAHGEIGCIAALADPDEGAFEFLDTFAIAFKDTEMDGDRISWSEVWNFGVHRGLYTLYKVIHDNHPSFN